VSLLVLTDDELALLRFTCDLFFVDESPLWPFDANPKEPTNHQHVYDALVARDVINPHEFQITDAALNRIAPVTECEAQLVHVFHDGHTTHSWQYFFLDDIGVAYEQPLPGKHTFGDDMESTAIATRISRGIEPRRAGGQLLDVVLPANELVVLASLLCRLKPGARQLSSADVQKALTRPIPDALLAHTTMRPRARRSPTWHQTLNGLVERKLVQWAGDDVEVAPALRVLAQLSRWPRHTFARVDYCDDERAFREVTFVQGAGSLFCIGPSRGHMAILELDGTRLQVALQQAIARPSLHAAAPQRLASLLQNRGQPIRLGQ
jgi:hypothetical protein